MSEKTSKPLVSVIITAHNRKEFLKESVGSVLRQTIPKDEFEIAVVKNFHDTEIDGYLRENGVKNIFTDELQLIRKHYAGIEATSGEIICFLDDDDMFHPKKLEIVKEQFMKQNISYYHNSYTSSKSEFQKLKPADNAPVMVFDSRSDKGSTLREISRHSPSANPSSISISRELATFAEKTAQKVTRNVDVFWFLSSLELGKPIVIDHRKLVFYRVQTSGTSRASNPEKVARYALDTLDNVEWQLESFHSSEAVRYLNDVRNIWAYRYAVASKLPNRVILSRTGNLLFRTMRPLSPQYRAAIIFIALASLISGRFGAYIYCKFIV